MLLVHGLKSRWLGFPRTRVAADIVVFETRSAEPSDVGVLGARRDPTARIVAVLVDHLVLAVQSPPSTKQKIEDVGIQQKPAATKLLRNIADQAQLEEISGSLGRAFLTVAPSAGFQKVAALFTFGADSQVDLARLNGQRPLQSGGKMPERRRTVLSISQQLGQQIVHVGKAQGRRVGGDGNFIDPGIHADPACAGEVQALQYLQNPVIRSGKLKLG